MFVFEFFFRSEWRLPQVKKRLPPGITLPPLPPRNVGNKLDPMVVSERLSGLQFYLSSLVSMEAVRVMPVFRRFLEEGRRLITDHDGSEPEVYPSQKKQYLDVISMLHLIGDDAELCDAVTHVPCQSYKPRMSPPFPSSVPFSTTSEVPLHWHCAADCWRSLTVRQASRTNEPPACRSA